MKKMKTTKIINLLVDIANGKEVPLKIRWGVHEFEWFAYEYEYKAKDESQEPTLFDYLSQVPSMLNDEVEIIEDIPKENKKIEKFYFSLYQYDKLGGTEIVGNLESKINEIIDKINEMSDKE